MDELSRLKKFSDDYYEVLSSRRNSILEDIGVKNTRLKMVNSRLKTPIKYIPQRAATSKGLVSLFTISGNDVWIGEVIAIFFLLVITAAVAMAVTFAVSVYFLAPLIITFIIWLLLTDFFYNKNNKYINDNVTFELYYKHKTEVATHLNDAAIEYASKPDGAIYVYTSVSNQNNSFSTTIDLGELTVQITSRISSTIHRESVTANNSGTYAFTLNNNQKLSVKLSGPPNLKSGISEINSIQLEIDQLNLQLKTQEEIAKIDIDKVLGGWVDVVLNDGELENIVKHQLLFMYGDKSSARGLLLKGPPGTGKTISASAFAKSSGCNFFMLSVSDLKGSYMGESGKNVKELWSKARASNRAVIFIDECEGVFAKRGSSTADQFSTDIVQAFLTEWDGIGKKSGVIVIGATNKPDLIDDAIMSRFSEVISILPIKKDKIPDLIRSICNSVGIHIEPTDNIVSAIIGLGGREISTIIKEAYRSSIPHTPSEENIIEAAKKIRGKTSSKTMKIGWDSLILEDDLKNKLKNLAIITKDIAEMIERKIPVQKSLLLYGPPGTGKTQIARVIASEAGLNFISKSTADLKGQYIGHSAVKIKEAFEAARNMSPSILFIDEIESLVPSRGQGDSFSADIVTQLLQEMDGILDNSGHVLVIAATNLPNNIDSAILSRFDKRLEIGLPGFEERVKIIEVELDGRPVDSDIALIELAESTNGYSGRDLKNLLSNAFSVAVDRQIANGLSVLETILQRCDIESVLVQKNSRQ